MPTTEYGPWPVDPFADRPAALTVVLANGSAGCEACSATNYERDGTAEFKPLDDVPIWELRVCGNGFQTHVTRLCSGCAHKLAEQIRQIPRKADR